MKPFLFLIIIKFCVSIILLKTLPKSAEKCRFEKYILKYGGELVYYEENH